MISMARAGLCRKLLKMITQTEHSHGSEPVRVVDGCPRAGQGGVGQPQWDLINSDNNYSLLMCFIYNQVRIPGNTMHDT